MRAPGDHDALVLDFFGDTDLEIVDRELLELEEVDRRFRRRGLDDELDERVRERRPEE